METQWEIKEKLHGFWQWLWDVDTYISIYTRKNSKGKYEFGIYNVIYPDEMLFINIEQALTIGNPNLSEFKNRIKIVKKLGIAEFTKEKVILK